MTIQLDQVKSSYNGKVGCMCGCLGKYSVMDEAARVVHNTEAGYESLDADDIKPRAVKLAVTKLNKLLNMDDDQRKTAGVDYFNVTDEWVSAEVGGRNTTVYLK